MSDMQANGVAVGRLTKLEQLTVENQQLLENWRLEGERVEVLEQEIELLNTLNEHSCNQRHALRVLIEHERRGGKHWRRQLRKLYAKADIEDVASTIASIKGDNVLSRISIAEKMMDCETCRVFIKRMCINLKDAITGRNKLREDLDKQQRLRMQLENEQNELKKKLATLKSKLFTKLEQLHHQGNINRIGINAAEYLQWMTKDPSTSAENPSAPSLPLVKVSVPDVIAAPLNAIQPTVACHTAVTTESMSYGDNQKLQFAQQKWNSFEGCGDSKYNDIKNNNNNDYYTEPSTINSNTNKVTFKQPFDLEISPTPVSDWLAANRNEFYAQCMEMEI